MDRALALALASGMDGMVEAFAEQTAEKITPESPRLCSIYLRDVIGLLPRETCGGMRLVSGRLDDELCSYPSSRLPKKIL